MNLRAHALAVAVVALAWLGVAWPALDLPFSAVDDPQSFLIARRVEGGMSPHAAGIASYPGRLAPLFYAHLWACWKAFGGDAFGHRLVHSAYFLGIALWVYACVVRLGGSRGVSALAAIGFLMFPGQYEGWPELQPIEPLQTLCAASFVELLLRPRTPALVTAACLVVCLASKETSLSLALPLAVAAWRRPEARRSRCLAALALVAWVLLFVFARTPAAGSAWVDHYRPGVASALATLGEVLALTWKSAGPLVFVGLLGLAVKGAVRDERTWVIAAWALGGVLIFLPWRQLGPRHVTWFAAPLAVLVGSGFARLAATRLARPAGAIGAASLAWMAAQYAVTMDVTLARYRAMDGALWGVVDGVAASAPRGARLGGDKRAAEVVRIFAAEARGRSDLTAGDGAGDLAVFSGSTWADLTARAAAGHAPALIFVGRNVERDLPEPRYALALARRALAGARGPDGGVASVLVPRLFERTACWAVFAPARGQARSSSGSIVSPP